MNKVDGQGYNEFDTNVIIMNASSGQKDKELVYAKDDTLKSINGFICALEASLRRYP